MTESEGVEAGKELEKRKAIEKGNRRAWGSNVLC